MIIHEIITALQVREAALLFRGCIESPSGFGTKDLTWSFFEPESVTDPFAVLDGPAEEPSFTVGASYRLRDTRLGYQSGIREKVQQSSHGTLILLVFERGDHRLLEVQQQGALSLASKKVAKGFLEALAGADETASISTEKTRR